MQPQKEIQVTYNPHEHQIPFHKDRYKIFARLISTGTGAGKTLCGAYESILWALENPGSVGYAFEPTYKMVKRILLPTLESPLLLGSPLESSPLIERYNKSDSCLTFINKSKMWMIGLEDPQSAEGPNVDWIWSDESRLIRHLDTAWRVWMRRLRGSVPGKFPVGIWLTTTPDMPGSELHKHFENPTERLHNSKVYRWTIDDNPHLTEDYIKEVKRVHTGGLYDRFVLGRFAAVAAGSFAFDYNIHVREDFPKDFRFMIYGVDFGWTNPSCIVCVGVDGDGRAYVVDEFYKNRVRIQNLHIEASNMESDYGTGAFVCDRSEPGTIEELKSDQTIDDIEYDGLDAEPDKSKRDSGIRALGGRFENAGDGKPRIFIHSRCVNLISELQIYDENRKENDHAVDALRYALASLEDLSGEIKVSFGRRPR